MGVERTTSHRGYLRGDPVNILHYGRIAPGHVVALKRTPEGKHGRKITVQIVGGEIVDAKLRKVEPVFKQKEVHFDDQGNFIF